eukprot:TRINITY_DN298_c0_g1_i7.p2 TRINITY_DN298_c0_g1~~TRINITY_DN298_c0_g1_i7.p2  ORF type:complete len:319 (+),score=100.42 TRINITY_DN298_c0_g1_i7:1501-2457(+)
MKSALVTAFGLHHLFKLLTDPQTPMKRATHLEEARFDEASRRAEELYITAFLDKVRLHCSDRAEEALAKIFLGNDGNDGTATDIWKKDFCCAHTNELVANFFLMMLWKSQSIETGINAEFGITMGAGVTFLFLVCRYFSKDQLRKLKAFQQMKLIGKNLVDLTQKVEIKKGDDRISRTLDCLTNKVIVAIDVLEMNGDLRKSDDRFNSLYGEAGSVSKPVAEEKKEASIGHSGYRMIHKSLLTHDVDYYRVKDDLEYNEKCEWCDQGGKIIECDRCNLVYHPYCLSPKFDEKNNAEDYLFCCCEEDWKEVQELSKKSF